MADNSGQADIRGLDIDKLAKGFADEESVFKQFVTVTPTAAREIRWYQKTSGFITSTTTSGLTGSLMNNVAERSQPSVAEQSWTRNTSYVRKYFIESPLLSDEDIKDSDIDILATNIRDLVRAVANQVDFRIYDVISDTQATGSAGVNTTAATGTGWDDGTNGNPVLDIMVAKRKIRQNGYNPEGAILAMDSLAHQQLLNYLITVKGSSIPAFSSEKVRTGVVMELLGVNIVVSENAVTDSVTMWLPQRSGTWKSFMPITSTTISDPGIGTKIRCWEEGECILTDPKSVHVTTDTTT
jgi:hypothetical protein